MRKGGQCEEQTEPEKEGAGKKRKIKKNPVHTDAAAC